MVNGTRIEKKKCLSITENISGKSIDLPFDSGFAAVIDGFNYIDCLLSLKASAQKHCLHPPIFFVIDVVNIFIFISEIARPMVSVDVVIVTVDCFRCCGLLSAKRLLFLKVDYSADCCCLCLRRSLVFFSLLFGSVFPDLE